MDHPLRRPDEILAYRPLRQILAARPNELWTIAPKDNVLTAMHRIAAMASGGMTLTKTAAVFVAIAFTT